MSRLLCILGCAWLLAGCAMSRSVPAEPLNESDTTRYVVVTLRNDAVPSIPRAGSTVRGYEPAPSYALAPATRASAKAVATAHGLREVAAWPIGLLGIHCVVFELPPGVDRNAALERLRRDNRVETAQPYQSFSTLTSEASTISASDPYRPLQRNLDVMDVGGAHMWSRGEGVRVAIIDTGIDANHPDLAGRVVKQENFVDGGKITARERHGTAVAGVIAAVENNSQGIVGVAPAAHLYSMRACWPAPADDSRAVCSTLTLAKALAAAIEERIDIVNLSLTGPSDPLLTRLIDVGLRRGVVFVGATPPINDGNGFPTGIPGVIGVDAAGAKVSADSVPVLFAPGSEVLTLVPDGRYDFLSGSSLAAASVSGGVALLLARDHNLRADNARDLLARSSRKVSTSQGEAASVNLCAAMAALMHQPTCKD
ncbi:MAG TPA: S8 family serine peptidase [Steroidobacteraceae bacterium]|nr:S8 family serine peptidase [Steroidobacteraceae bacterium]